MTVPALTGGEVKEFDPTLLLVTIALLGGLAFLVSRLFSLRRATFDACLIPPEDQIVRLLMQLGRADADDLGNRMFPLRAGNDIVPLLESMARSGTLVPIYDLGHNLDPNQIPYKLAL